MFLVISVFWTYNSQNIYRLRTLVHQYFITLFHVHEGLKVVQNSAGALWEKLLKTVGQKYQDSLCLTNLPF